MSFSVIRLAKYTMGSVKGLEIHNKREKEGVSHSNPDIDWSRTEQNVSLGEEGVTYRQAIKDRLAEAYKGKKAIRKDAIVMCEALVTSDADFFKRIGKDATIDYFDKALDFIKEKYGADNLIDATLHFDEATPHMHVDFVPLTSDGRLCAKEVVGTKSALSSLQTQFNVSVGREFGLERGKKNGTQYKELKEFKLESAKQQLGTLNKAIEQAETTCKELDKIDQIKPEKTITGALKGITVEQVDELKDQAKNSVSLASQLESEKWWRKHYEEKYNNFNERDIVHMSKVYMEDAIDLSNKVEVLQKEVGTLREQNKQLADKLKAVGQFIKSNFEELHKHMVNQGLLQDDNPIKRFVAGRTRSRSKGIERD